MQITRDSDYRLNIINVPFWFLNYLALWLAHNEIATYFYTECHPTPAQETFNLKLSDGACLSKEKRQEIMEHYKLFEPQATQKEARHEN